MARASFAWAVVAVIAAVVAVTSAQAVDDITPSFAEVYPSASVRANGDTLGSVVYVRVAGRMAIVTDVDTTNGLYVDFVPPPCYPTEGCETGQPVDVELLDSSGDPPLVTLVGGFTYQASECEAVTGCATSGEFLTEIAGAIDSAGANGGVVNSDTSGSAGFEFEVYETIEITHFGAFDSESDGFNGDYVSIKLWKDSDQSLIHQETLFGSTPVNNDLKPTAAEDVWQYIELANPITLTAGTYIITGFGYFDPALADHAGYAALNGYRIFTVNRGLGGLRHGAVRYSGAGAGDVFPASTYGFAGQVQVATATFKYRSLPATDAVVCMGTAPSCDTCVQTTCNAGCDPSSNLDPATDCTSCLYGWGATWPQCDDEGTITNPVNPASGVATGGTEVTIIGTALSETDGDVTEVNFDGRPATIKTQTTTEIVVWTPECPAGESCVGSAVDVEVVSSSNFGSATAVAAYTYSDRSVVTNISPTIGPHTGGTQVTLLGNNLGGGTASLWVDGVEAVVGTQIGTKLVATTGDCGAASDACTAAAGDIVLVHSFRGTYSFPDAFEYRAPGTVTSVTPDNGRYYGGNTVIIEGTFADDDVTSIFVGLVPASNVISLGGGAYAFDPGYCGGGCSASWGTPLDITITSTSVGVTTATAAYTYNPAADITGVVPMVGPLVGGNKVTITDGGLGSGSDITNVDFVVSATSASIAAAIHSQTASSVVVLVPACADNDGNCAVTTDPGSPSFASIEVTSTSIGVTTETDTYAWLSPPAPITVNAAFGSVDGGTTVEIVGEDLGLYGDVTSVSIAGVEAASFVVNSATKVTAVTGACSGGSCTADTRGPVVVTSASCGTSTATLFEPELPTCCEVHGGAGCDDLTCAGTVCTMDSSCCDDAWTGACVAFVGSLCTSGLCDLAADSCCAAHGGTGCSESTCADLVCANYDSTCCTGGTWTADCATAATAMCNGLCGVQTAFEYKAKVINSVSPSEGPFNGGTSVTITGENLLLHSTASPSGDVIVMIGSVPATLVDAHPGWITVTTGDCEADPGCTPDDATSLDVDVIDPVFGWSAGAGAFTYNAERTVTAITPTQGPWHTGLDVVIDGDFETGIETVRIGLLTSTDLTELGPGSVSAALTGTCTPGTYVVEVWSPTHGWAASSAPLFTCNPASMGIQISPSISASTGPGSVTFLGTNLGSGSDVESLVVAGVTAAITSQTPTSVVADLGGCVADSACDTTGDVVSFSPSNGYTTLTNGYTYRGVPDIDSTVPPSGGQTFYGGHRVTIVGEYLADTDTADVTSVVLAGVPVTAVVASDPTSIIVEVGPCGDLCDVGTPGDIEVSSSAYGNSVLSGGYTYQEEACYQYDHTAACTTSIWEARDTLDDGVPGFLGTIIQEFAVTTTGVYALRLGLYDDDGLGVKGRVEVTLRSGDGATTIETTFAAVIGTPPYMVDGDGPTAFRTYELVGAPVHLAPGTWFLEADYVEAGERPVIGTDLGLNAVGGPWLDLVSTTVITDGGATTNVYSPSDVKALTLVVVADASNRAVCYGADFDCKACDVTHPCTSCDDTYGMYDVTTRCTTCLPGWGPAFPDCSDEGTITQVVPTHGPDYGGDTMTIYGTALVMGSGDAISVLFNAVEVPALDSGIDESGREYVVVETPPIPAGATLDTNDVSIQVVASSSYLVSVASASLFTYRSKPTINTQDVNEGPHTGGTTVTFAGSNWLSGTSGVTVTVGGIAANVVSRTGTGLVITTNGNCETNPGCVTGTASTMVFSAPGIGTRTYSNIFTYNPPMVITDVQPTCGPAYGDIDLSIYGTNFGVDATDGVVSVGAGNVYSGASIVTATPTKVVLSSLAACGSFGICATDVDVTMVSTTHAATTAVDAFSYREATAFDSVTPSTGPYHGGNKVTITGVALGDGQDIFRVTLTPADSAARTAASIEDQGMNFVVVTVPDGDLLCATATISGCAAVVEIESVCSGVTTATGGYRFNPNPLTPDSVSPISVLPLVPTEAGVDTVRTYSHSSGVFYHDNDIFAVSLVDGSGVDGAAVIDWDTDTDGQTFTVTYGPCTAPVDTMLDLVITSLSFGTYTLEDVAECDELTISAPTPTIRPWFGADPLSIVTAKSRSSSLGVDTVSAVYFGSVENPASTNTFDGDGFGTLTVTSVPPCVAAGGCDGSPIDVTIAYEGAGSDTTTFSYYRQPMITMVEPTCGYRFGGRTVTVWGHDFGDVASVDFGGVAASMTASSSTAVVVVTGDCVGDVGCDPGDVVDVHVVSAVRGDATSVAAYEYLLATTIDAVTGEVTARAGGDRVTIAGSNLQFGGDVTTVTLSGVAVANVVWQDEDMVVVDTAPCWDCRGCPGDVVVDSAKVGETTLIEAFEYLHAGAVTGVSPDWAFHYGTRVTVAGRQLGVESDIYAVTVDGLDADIVSQTTTSVVVDVPGCESDGRDCEVPVSALPAGDVVVSSAHRGVSTATGAFRFRPKPTIGSIVPTRGPYTGWSATIFGAHMTTTAEVESVTVSLQEATVTSPIGAEATSLPLTTPIYREADQKFTSVGDPFVSFPRAGGVGADLIMEFEVDCVAKGLESNIRSIRFGLSYWARDGTLGEVTTEVRYIASATQLFAPFDTSTWTAADDFVIDDEFVTTVTYSGFDVTILQDYGDPTTPCQPYYYVALENAGTTQDNFFVSGCNPSDGVADDPDTPWHNSATVPDKAPFPPTLSFDDFSLAIQSCSQMWYARKSANSLVGGFASETLGPVGLGSGGESDTTAFVFYPFDDTTLDNLIDAVVDEGLPVSEAHIDLAIGSGSATNVPPLTISGLLFDDALNTLFESDYAAHITSDVTHYHSGEYGAFPNGDDEYGPADAARPIFDVVANLMSPNSFVQRATTSASVVWTLETSLTAATPASHTRSSPPGGTTDIYTFEIYAEDEIWVTALDPFRGFAASLAANVEVHYTAESGAPDPAWTLIGFSEVEASILFDEPIRIPSGESYAFRVEAVCGSFTTGPACDPADAGVLEEFNGGELTLWNVQVDFGGPSLECVDIDIDIAYSRIEPTAGVQTSPDLSAIVQEFMDDLEVGDLPVHTMVLRIEGGDGLVLEATGGALYAAAASGIIVIDVPDCDGNNCLEDMQGDVEVCSEFYGCDTLENVFMYSSPSQVTSTVPTWGPAVGGNVVTILGDGLGDGSDIFQVSIEGNLASIEDQTCTSVVVTIPACTEAACTGGSDFDADVTVKSTFFGVTTGADLYHYNAAGMITMVDPTAGQYRGANWVTIYGTGLGSGDDITTVTLWGIATRVLEQTPTSVVVVAGACTGDFCTDAPGEVVVTSVAYGVTSQAGAYQYLVDESCRLFKECDDVESELCAMSETCEVYPCPVSMGGRCSWCRDPCNDPVADCHDRGISSYFPGFDLDDICP